MAPGTRRAGTRGGYAEHDDFEGLPVRQWRQEWSTIVPPPQQEPQSQNDIWAIELIHGMPKDANLLPTHTQELLRAARSGAIYKRQPLVEEEEGPDPEAILSEKPEKKEEEDETVKGYTVRTWKQLPRNVEANTTSYLAPRRKGIVRIASKTVEEKIVGGATVTRATVRRIDAAGNPYTEEVTLVDGQQVEGEIIATRQAPVAGLGEGLAPPPVVRKRPPPPKRKGGPGRGKKKIKLPLPGPGVPSAGGAVGTDAAVKLEGDHHGERREGEANHDSEMADGDENDEDDEEDEDEGDEGDGAESGNDKDMSDVTQPIEPSVLDNADIEMTDGQPSERKTPPPNPLTLAPPAASLATASPKVEGSPLKNVAVASPPALEVAPDPQATAIVEVPAVTLPPIDKPPVEDSVVAEPPSTIVGEEPDKAADRDIPKDIPPGLPQQTSTEEALLPPPPDQVGNISSPKDSPAVDKSSEASPTGGKADVQPGEEAVPARPDLTHTLTEDTIKPDDSASAVDVSGPPSEAALATSVQSDVEVPSVAEEKNESPEEPMAAEPTTLTEEPAVAEAPEKGDVTMDQVDAESPAQPVQKSPSAEESNSEEEPPAGREAEDSEPTPVDDTNKEDPAPASIPSVAGDVAASDPATVDQTSKPASPPAEEQKPDVAEG
ncbi:uncharacterized protein J7T54_005151 [Emericellopsis cladophorae]|uniref:LYR family protein n=1 Tax=Emericellopsis cladophorae TaxID=2686198 RepID=A0A9Q0BEJ8_9HYPO|nr:uncharacterized protein J7T54_005151 [Emericellopsis cladophorae]KAI6781941.1 hypothetical protein J7T54_005151 [Emericellopsis cladophorae]